MEQIYRDARISTIYEGTTGVQALDLLGRKVLLNKGKYLRRFTKDILKYTVEAGLQVSGVASACVAHVARAN